MSHHPHLLEQGIDADPAALDTDALCRMAWSVLEPSHRRRLAELRDRFGEARAHGRGTDSLAAAAEAVVQSRIETLLVDQDRTIPGRIGDDGRFTPGERADASTDDVLDDLAERVLRAGGEAIVLPHDQMPTTTGLAAIYRY